MSHRLQAHGISWARSHVAAIEGGGRGTIDVGTLVLIARAFGVPVTELLAGDGPVRLTDEATWTRQALRDLLSGEEGSTEEITLTGRAFRAMVDLAGGTYVQVNPYQADTELAARLGVRPDAVIQAAETLWNSSLQQERDRRIAAKGELSPAQLRAHRGHVTRELAKEIDAVLRERGEAAE